MGTYIFQFEAQNSNGTNIGLDTTGIIVFAPTIPPTSQTSILSLFTDKQWIADTVYSNYTGPGTGSLVYVFGSNGSGGIAYQPYTWSFINSDSTIYETVGINGSPTYIARILKLDSTHLTVYDSTSQALDISVMEP